MSVVDDIAKGVKIEYFRLWNLWASREIWDPRERARIAAVLDDLVKALDKLYPQGWRA